GGGRGGPGGGGGGARGREGPRPAARGGGGGAGGEAAGAVPAVAARASVAEAHAVELAFVVVQVVVPDERAHHVAPLHERGEEAAVEGGPAGRLLPVAAAGSARPDLLVLREGDVEEGERGEAAGPPR